MSTQAVLLPLFVQVALTFVLLISTGIARRGAVLRREVRLQEVALREPNWPADVTKIANAFQNQLELPLLFLVLTILALITRQADLLFVVLAWIFVLTRLAHALVFVTSNHVPHRFYLFLLGAIILMVMWMIFAVRILLAV